MSPKAYPGKNLASFRCVPKTFGMEAWKVRFSKTGQDPGNKNRAAGQKGHFIKRGVRGCHERMEKNKNNL